MQQKMPWEEDWSQPQGMAPAGPLTITTSRDPREVARQDSADMRSGNADRRADRADDRAEARDNRTAAVEGARLQMERRRLELAEREALAKQPGETNLDSVRAEALDKIRLARSLQQRSRDGWFTTGFGAGTVGSIGGTGAYDVRQDTETLKNAGALTRIMEMAVQNGGKNPLTPLSNSDFQALSSSLSNLDTSQSDAQYQANVQRVIDLYTRAYQGAGGKDLERDLEGRTPDDAAAAAGRTSGTPPSAMATGGTKADRNPEREKALDALIRSGADMSTINATSRAMGGMDLDAARVDEWKAFFAKNPNYRGGSVDSSAPVQTTAWNRFAASPIGTGIYAGVDAGMAGLTDEFASALGGGDLSDLNARKQAAFAENPKATFAGQALGTIGSMTGLGVLGRTTGIASRFANPQLLGDLAFGAASGFGQSNDNRLVGGALGAGGAFAGNVIGNQVARGVGALGRTDVGMRLNNSLRGIVGANPLPNAQPLTGVDSTIYQAINKAGFDDVTRSLSEARDLNIPMSFADTNPNLRELAGAAVRRSPAASAFAEDALIPRSRGQYDRFTSSVESNLGPTTNIPEHSANLMAQARANAAGLYDRAYSTPVPSTPELDAVLNTPFGRQALGRARTIAANERRSPDELGFGLNQDGSVMLNPRPNELIAQHLGARAEFDAAQEAYRAARQNPNANVEGARNQMMAAREKLRLAESRLGAAPDSRSPASVPAYTTQTLDYVKRGMDDVLEGQRNPITGKLVLDEAGRAQNGVRSQFLREVDQHNPDFAAARQAYAGPMAARDALERGADAYRLHPDEIGIQVGSQSPAHLDQMRLGYRGAMVDHASRIRDAGNPWDATLGSPVARQRLMQIYSDNPNIQRMLRQVELEMEMARTTNAVLGNSRTARNQIADQAFSGSPMVEGALHAGAAVATQGASLPGTAARLVGSGLKDRLALGMGRNAERRADEIAPVLINPDPDAALTQAMDYLDREQAWNALVERTTPRRLSGMLFRGFGSQAAVAPVNQ